MYYIATGNRVHNNWYFGKIVFLCSEILCSVQRCLKASVVLTRQLLSKPFFQIRRRYYILRNNRLLSNLSLYMYNITTLIIYINICNTHPGQGPTLYLQLFIVVPFSSVTLWYIMRVSVVCGRVWMFNILCILCIWLLSERS